MTPAPDLAFSPVISIHVAAMVTAVLLGPFAIWARKVAIQRPKLHRAFGYAWVTCMLAASISALFIRSVNLPNIAGYSWIHLLIPVTWVALFGAFWFLAKGNIRGHRITMINLYIGACLVAGAFTLLPGRRLGLLVWHTWLGLM